MYDSPPLGLSTVSFKKERTARCALVALSSTLRVKLSPAQAVVQTSGKGLPGGIVRQRHPVQQRNNARRERGEEPTSKVDVIGDDEAGTATEFVERK